MIKSLKKNDIKTTPFTATKKWNPQNKVHKDLILWQSGSVSGSLSLTFKEYNDGTVTPYTYISSAISLQQQEDDYLRFREGINLSGSISPTGSFYHDPILSEKNIDGTYKTVLYATTKHLFYNESQDPTKIFGLESLDSSKVNRSLPNKISTFNVPQNKFGEKILPNSVKISHEIQGLTYNVVDDGNSNLVLSEKTFINNQDANIDKVRSSIVFNNVDKNNTIYTVYNGLPKTVTATTSPSNLSYYVTYDGSKTPPTNVGVYTIIATIDDNFYTGTITGTLIITKASATITISNLNQTYDGNPKSVNVSIPSVNVNYNITYNDFTAPPTNAGTYNVVVTIIDPNYQGSASAKLIIAPKTLSITTQCPSKTYGDADFTIPVNSDSNGAISYTKNSGPATIINGNLIRITGVGTLDVTINQAASGNYSAASVNCSSITISPKQLTVTGITANDKGYDGNKLATLNTSSAALQGIVSRNEKPDTVILGGSAEGEFSDNSAGEGKTVTISGLTISGPDSSKYTLVQPTTTAAIKSNSESGTITMADKKVVYNEMAQSLSVTVSDSQMPIKITYKSQNNDVLRVDRLYQTQLIKLSGTDYPKNVSKYNVVSELDASISTIKKYTVSNVTSTLEIISVQGDVTFGPNIFYYNGEPKPVQILTQFPRNKELVITYNGSSTIPSVIGTYKVNVKFKDPNIFFNKDVTLIIKAIPTQNCGENITQETKNQQYQYNIINLTSLTGKVKFYYYVNSGASQFKIEYPLNSGNFVYDSYLRSKSYAVGSEVTDYVTKSKISVSGIQNPENNVPITIEKNKTGVNNGQDNDKCLVTVYSPTDNNDWNYSVSCVDVPPPPPPSIGDLKNGKIDLTVSLGPNDITPQKRSSWLLAPLARVLKDNLEPQLKTQLQGGSITQFEYDAILRILKDNDSTNSIPGVSYVWTDTTSNIKINVGKSNFGYNEYAKFSLNYERMTDSLAAKSDFGPFVFDCHLYKYKGNKPSFDLQDAKESLQQQIQSDTFKDTFLGANNTITNGEIQREILKTFVNDLTDKIVYNQIYKIDTSLSPNPNIANSNIESQLKILIYYVNTSTQEVQIVYPAICQPINFGQLK